MALWSVSTSSIVMKKAATDRTDASYRATLYSASSNGRTNSFVFSLRLFIHFLLVFLGTISWDYISSFFSYPIRYLFERNLFIDSCMTNIVVNPNFFKIRFHFFETFTEHMGIFRPCPNPSVDFF